MCRLDRFSNIAYDVPIELEDHVKATNRALEIWIVTIGEPIIHDKNSLRIHRSGLLAKYISENSNHELICIEHQTSLIFYQILLNEKTLNLHHQLVFST